MIFNIIVSKPINLEVLDQEFSGQLQDYEGADYSPNLNQVNVHTTSDLDQLTAINLIIDAHDSNTPTERQLDKQAVITELEVMRDYLQNPSPTNTQSVQVIKAIIRVVFYIGKYIARIED